MAESPKNSADTPQSDDDSIVDNDDASQSTNRFQRFDTICLLCTLFFVAVLALNETVFPDHPATSGGRPPTARELVSIGCFLVAAIASIVSFLNFPTFLCPHCGKHLDTNNDWLCGYCDSLNQANGFGVRRNMLNRCRSCSRRAQSLICYHCSGRVCLAACHDQRHPAQILTSSENPPKPLPPPVGNRTLAAPVVSAFERKEQLDSLKQEKQRIDQETEIMNARIALATAESRFTEIKAGTENRFKSVITRMLQPLDDKRQRREALLLYGQSTRTAIDARNDLTADQKSMLKEALDIDIEQAGLEDA